MNFVVRTVNYERRSNLYIHCRIYLYRASPKDQSSTGLQYASVLGSPTIKGDIMTNNTTTNETTNLTNGLEEAESGMLDGLMDMLSGSPELMLAVAVIGALVAYISYTQPAVKALIMPYIMKYEDELNDILDNYLTAAQTKAYKKLDEAAQKHVKDAMLRNVILSAWDQNDEKFVAVVKAEVKEAMASAKQL